MNLVIKFSPDITIKSKFVRKEMSRRVENNIRLGIRKFLEKEDFVLKREFDRMTFFTENTEYKKELKSLFQSTPGVAFFHEYQAFDLVSFDDVFETVLQHQKEKVDGKTFRVSVKRSGFHAFTSVQLEKFIGGGLAQHTSGTVKLTNFDHEVKIEVKDEKYFLLSDKILGLGGLPIFSEKRVVSLISGGFDSAVSSFLMMRKGCPTDFLFFNLGGIDQQIGVQKISTFIAEKFSAGYDPYFISIPFTPIIQELMKKNITPKYRGIILKRCMMKVAEKVSKEMKHHSIITGESLAQVSSQTLQNLKVIENSLQDTPLFRPLFAFNKAEIINFTRQMGTEKFSAQMPEYCGVVSEKPSTNAKQKDIDFEETKFPFEILEKVFECRNVARISTLQKEEKTPLKTVSKEEIEKNPENFNNFIIIDLREKDIFDKNPFTHKEFEEKNILNIPFFEIDEKFPTLDQTKNYLFTCAKGVMSQSHARLLQRKGFENIYVFKQESEMCKA